ncbi:DJ-1/PfpI family protein [Leishmania donovani]|uniref:DJ-1/PfpI family protein n=1 Tax=Leishmania donovani TaxID=5661 RepID=A0A504X6P2_LEIDO|nr:DJ-1/PfpI family protein [Leishmania donovani]
MEVRGHNFIIRNPFDEVNVVEYQGLYITGERTPKYIRLSQKVFQFTRHFFNHNLPVAATCVTESRTLTCYPAVSPGMIIAGGKYKEVLPTEMVKDGSLITSPAWSGD